MSLFGGFLLLRGRFPLSLARKASAFLSDRVSFAERGRGLVQAVLADLRDATVNVLNSPAVLEPVLAELHFATHRPLVASESRLVLPETVARDQELALGLDARIPPCPPTHSP
jgi:hypothetical protein